MKCDKCGGSGKSPYGYGQKCLECDGKGIVEPLTNEEWLRNASTEELAEFLTEIKYDKNDMPITFEEEYEWRLAWLKEK